SRHDSVSQSSLFPPVKSVSSVQSVVKIFVFFAFFCGKFRLWLRLRCAVQSVVEIFVSFAFSVAISRFGRGFPPLRPLLALLATALGAFSAFTGFAANPPAAPPSLPEALISQATLAPWSAPFRPPHAWHAHVL